MKEFWVTQRRQLHIGIRCILHSRFVFCICCLLVNMNAKGDNTVFGFDFCQTINFDTQSKVIIADEHNKTQNG